jgi:hypothetical protein
MEHKKLWIRWRRISSQLRLVPSRPRAARPAPRSPEEEHRRRVSLDLRAEILQVRRQITAAATGNSSPERHHPPPPPAARSRP